MRKLDEISASFIFFTRLPLLHKKNLPNEAFEKVVVWWPYTGWVIAVIWAAIYYFFSHLVNQAAGAFLAYSAVVWLTGALHEDGLADFVDAFGIKHSCGKTLEIMKDSHIGTFGVLGLIFYFGISISFIAAVPVTIGAMIFIAGNPWVKFLTGQIVNFLPYARKPDQSKNQTMYVKNSITDILVSFLGAIIPIILIIVYAQSLLIPILTGMGITIIGLVFLIILMKKRINGYTGDCCGATALLLNMFFIFSSVIMINLLDYASRPW